MRRTKDARSFWDKGLWGGLLLGALLVLGAPLAKAAQSVSYEYDPANNNLLAKTVDGLRTEYGNYDSNGNPGYKIDAAGTTKARRTDYTYDSRFHSKLQQKTVPSVYPGASKITIYARDDYANVTSLMILGYAPDGTGESRQFTMQYNGPLHQLSQIAGPRNDVSQVTTLDYYPNDPNEGNNRARLKRVTGPLGIVLRDNIQYTATGKIASETRVGGVTLTYTYYPGNDRLQTQNQTSQGVATTTRWTYLDTGEVKTVTVGDGTPDATTVTLGYDDARRLTRVTDGLANYIAYTLDTEGNRIAEKTYDVNGNLRRSISRTFDAYNRVNTVTLGNETYSQTINIYPNGTLNNETDRKGTKTQYGYDELQRLKSVTEDVGGSDPTTADTLTQYGYDVADNVTQVTAPNNATTTYIYDDLGNLLKETSPDRGTLTYTYDPAGNVQSVTDARGITTTYTYDALNRVLTQSSSDPSTPSYQYYYDDCRVGKLCHISRNSEADAVFNYDPLGRLAFRLDARVSLYAIYGYDSAGRVNDLTYPDGMHVTYKYDAAGKVSEVHANINGTDVTLASPMRSAPFGPVTFMTFGDGSQYSETLDLAYHPYLLMSGGWNVNSQFDPNGNFHTITHADNSAQTYDYDPLDRLISGTDSKVGGFGSQGFGYDTNGNRSSLTNNSVTIPYAYETNSNRLKTVNGVTVTADADGNITNGEAGAGTLTYNGYGELVASTSGNTSYSYTPFGVRASKTVNGSATSFLYAPEGQLLAEKAPSGTIRDYVYVDGKPIVMIEGATIRYIHTDQLGTPRTVTDSTGTVVWTWASDPFGTTAANEDPDGDGTTLTLNLRFPGQYYDAETGLHYNYFRYYDPNTGRYVSSDPIGLNGGINTYGYVTGNPLRWVDPQGLVEIDPAEPDYGIDGPGGGMFGGGGGGVYIGGDYGGAAEAAPVEALAPEGPHCPSTGAAATRGMPTVNGRAPINSRYANQTHPSGVKFNAQGFPDFAPYAEEQVTVDGLTGDYRTDATLANKAAGLKRTPEGYVWHHVEDTKTMQLIPKNIHNSARHTGGAAIIRNGGLDQ